MFQVPPDGFNQAGFQGFCRLPAQFPPDFCDFHGIAPVMTGAIGDIFHQAGMGGAAGKRAQLVQNGTNCGHNFNIGRLIITANGVSFAVISFF